MSPADVCNEWWAELLDLHPEAKFAEKEIRAAFMVAIDAMDIDAFLKLSRTFQR